MRLTDPAGDVLVTVAWIPSAVLVYVRTTLEDFASGGRCDFSGTSTHVPMIASSVSTGAIFTEPCGPEAAGGIGARGFIGSDRVSGPFEAGGFCPIGFSCGSGSSGE